MTGLAAIGYFLCGLGTGLFANGFILDYELRRPIGKDELIEPIESSSKESKTEERTTNRENAKEGLRIDLKGSRGYSREVNATNYARYFEERDEELDLASREHPLDDDEENEKTSDSIQHVENVLEDEDQHDVIFQIGEDEYCDAESANYDKIAVIYYEGDNTYTDESTDNLFPAFEDHIGSEPLEFDDDDMAYVRNEDERTDYAIHRVEVGYVEAVLGISSDDDPNPKRPRKMRENEYD